ncbi:MAG: acetyl-coenzyme A synthetase N-terminal domain-containing protein, partial [Pseudomonadota bacterium]
MSDQERFPPSPETAARAHVDAAKYEEMYEASVSDPEAFWGEQGRRLDWIKPYNTVKNTSYAHPDVSIKWYEDGVLNVCANCVDRHVEKRGDQTAIIWEGDDPALSDHITYSELYDRVRR